MGAAITLQIDMAELRRLTAFVKAFSVENAVSAEETSRVLIVLEELFTNLVKYGYPKADGKGVAEVALRLDGDRLTIGFDDNGAAFDPLSHAPPDLEQPVENRPVGGLGLQLLRSLVDEAHYSREGGRNRLVLMRRTVR